MAIVQLAPVQAPSREPLRGTLLDAATVVDGAPIGLLRESDLYESWACMRLYPGTNVCEPGAGKVFDAPLWPKAAFFTVQGGASCKGPGFVFNEGEAQLTATFLGLESSGVEAGIMETIFSTGNAIVLTDDAVPLLDAIGLLEGYAAANYSGIPTLHLPRNQVIKLCDHGALNTDGMPWRLCTGTKVAAGGGYMVSNVGPDGTPAPAGSQWMYVTGEVTVLRGTLTAQPAFDTSTNDMIFLAERSYLTSVDCLLAAAQVEAVVPDDGWRPPDALRLTVSCTPVEGEPGKVSAIARVV